MAGTAVFVSYSHDDAALVAPVVRLLRANRSLVFHDADSIAPGKRWRGQIDAGLAEAQLVVVFWCEHAHRSDEMTKEWSAAIAQGKDVLPLLLDATPLPAALAEFQWIDFRGTAGGTHRADDAAGAPARTRDGSSRVDIDAAAPQAPARRRYAFGTAAVLVALAPGLLWLYVQHRQASMPPPSAGPSIPGPPLPGSEIFHAPPAISPLFAGAAIAVMVGVLWLRRWWARSKLRRAAQEEIGRRMAIEIEAEIVRRAASGEGVARTTPAGAS